MHSYENLPRNPQRPWIAIVFEIVYSAELLARVQRAGPAGAGGCARAYSLFAENPEHPSLRFKKLGGYDHVWSVRINEQYRAVGERDGDTIVWVWIGSHNDFDTLFG